MYSLKDSFAIFFQYPPHYLTGPFETLQQEVFWALWFVSLLITDLQDGSWMREDEEAPVNRGTSKPGTWLFVLSSFWQCFGSDWCHCLQFTTFWSILFFCLLWAFRSDCYGFTIPSMWVCVSAFSATCCGLTVMELRGHSDKFWLSRGFVCCFVGWGCRNPLRARMWVCM